MNNPVPALIEKVCDDIKDLLITKNRKYGNSALQPVSIFYKGDTGDALRVRIDDKLSRVLNEQDDEDEDVVDDLIGYLVLYKVHKIMNKKGFVG
jgi:hypothetical protein